MSTLPSKPIDTSRACVSGSAGRVDTTRRRRSAGTGRRAPSLVRSTAAPGCRQHRRRPGRRTRRSAVGRSRRGRRRTPPGRLRRNPGPGWRRDHRERSAHHQTPSRRRARRVAQAARRRLGEAGPVTRPGAHPARGLGLEQKAVAVVLGLKHPARTRRPLSCRASEHRCGRHRFEARSPDAWCRSACRDAARAKSPARCLAGRPTLVRPSLSMRTCVRMTSQGSAVTRLTARDREPEHISDADPHDRTRAADRRARGCISDSPGAA